MTNRWLKGVAIVALTAGRTVAAQAADLPTRKEAPAPVFVPPPFTWTGFYVGLNAGGLWASGSRSDNLFVPTVFAFPLASFFPNGLGSNSSGFIGGGQAGYNWQTGAFVLGVETDFQGTSLSSHHSVTGTPFTAAGILTGDTFSVNSHTSVDWLGTTRARLGFVATPDNRLMIYATGGVAYAGGSANFSFFDARGAFWTANPSSSRVGWTAGAGVEYALTNNWTIRAEYLYADLGKDNFTSVGNLIAFQNFPGVYAAGHIDYTASIFRGAVNYKF